MGRDHTLYALIEGYVHFTWNPFNKKQVRLKREAYSRQSQSLHSLCRLPISQILRVSLDVTTVSLVCVSFQTIHPLIVII